MKSPGKMETLMFPFVNLGVSKKKKNCNYIAKIITEVTNTLCP